MFFPYFTKPFPVKCGLTKWIPVQTANFFSYLRRPNRFIQGDRGSKKTTRDPRSVEGDRRWSRVQFPNQCLSDAIGSALG